FHLWSERYERKMEDVFAIQDEISEAIATALKGKLLLPREPVRRYTASSKAYEFYLRGRYHWNRRTVASRQSGVTSIKDLVVGLYRDQFYRDEFWDRNPNLDFVRHYRGDRGKGGLTNVR